jgi:hypothetical protein
VGEDFWEKELPACSRYHNQFIKALTKVKYIKIGLKINMA